MARRKQQLPPQTPPRVPEERAPGLLELDRFSHLDLLKWRRLSRDLDEINNSLYFNLEPQRQRHHDELIAALAAVVPSSLTFTGWQRIISYQYSLAPLSAAGSLTSFGGRFNLGRDVDKAMTPPWPALYLAEDAETAFRERFQMDAHDTMDGLRPEELALVGDGSFAKVTVHGHLQQVFDIGAHGALDEVCCVLRRMKLPGDIRRLERRLGISRPRIGMIRTPSKLLEEVLVKNWRVSPAQFGLPAASQILADWIRQAGFEAIRYHSTKGAGNCLAVFPDKLVSDQSYVALTDDVPPGVIHTRLDLRTADALCGWEILRCSA